ATLAPARLLVPVVAVLDSVEDAGAAVGAEKDSHLATVTLQNSDGRSGLLAFTGTDALRAWRADARPVPAAAARVAAAALQEGADAVLLDVAGPVPFAVDRPVLLALAASRLPLPAHRDPEVATAVAGVLTAVAGGMEGARLGDGSGHRADLELALPAGLDQAVLEQIATAVAADPVLARRCPRGVALVVG
ncbi:MAG TPA: SseB family protein, partial [Candidatus Nanopelagicales bacterium]|nr:SseB family protein [Candidatus Nanopelagicales bacterium]